MKKLVNNREYSGLEIYAIKNSLESNELSELEPPSIRRGVKNSSINFFYIAITIDSYSIPKKIEHSQVTSLVPTYHKEQTVNSYEKYKDSKIEWLGEIPEHWGLIPLRYIAKVQTGNTPSKNIPDYYSKNEGLPWIKPDELNEFNKLSTSKEKLTQKGSKEARIISQGSILVCCIGTIGKIGVAGCDLSTNQQINSITFSKKIISNFGKYLIYSSSVEHSKLANGNVVRILNTNTQKSIKLVIPSILEQITIANFLDKKTAQIDEAIAIKEQQISLLKEHKQITIQQAVTQGINPNVTMRDSGVDWIGQIPEHWEIIPLKHICKFTGGGTPTKDKLCYWEGGTIPWVSPKDMKSDYISATQDYITVNAVKNSSTNYIPPFSLLLVVRSGILQRKIPVSINKVEVTLNQDMKALILSKKMNTKFLMNFILGNNNALLVEWTKEGATVESIEHEYLANGLISVPPLVEQQEINIFIERVAAKIDKAITLQNQQI